MPEFKYLNTEAEENLLCEASSRAFVQAMYSSWKDPMAALRALSWFEQFKSKNPTRAINMAFAILLFACRKFDVGVSGYCAPKLAQEMISRYPDLINMYDKDGLTAIMYAARWERFNVLAALMKFKPDLTIPSMQTRDLTKGHLCVDYGWNILEFLLYQSSKANGCKALRVIFQFMTMENMIRFDDLLDQVEQKVSPKIFTTELSRENLSSIGENRQTVLGILAEEMYICGPDSEALEDVFASVYGRRRASNAAKLTG